jgi:uncharacterized membrane protein (DUF373 family)
VVKTHGAVIINYFHFIVSYKMMEILYVLAILAVLGAIYYLAPAASKHVSFSTDTCSGDVCKLD